MRRFGYVAAVLAALLTACAAQPRAELPVPPLPVELLMEWPQDSGMRSPQELEEIAAMIGAEWDADRTQPLKQLVAEWVRQFCILNGWPTPECRPLYDRILALILNRT